jgi:hypothetical protein
MTIGKTWRVEMRRSIAATQPALLVRGSLDPCAALLSAAQGWTADPARRSASEISLV